MINLGSKGGSSNLDTAMIHDDVDAEVRPTELNARAKDIHSGGALASV